MAEGFVLGGLSVGAIIAVVVVLWLVILAKGMSR